MPQSFTNMDFSSNVMSNGEFICQCYKAKDKDNVFSLFHEAGGYVIVLAHAGEGVNAGRLVKIL